MQYHARESIRVIDISWGSAFMAISAAWDMCECNLPLITSKNIPQIIKPSTDLAQQHYQEHEGKPFYPGLVQFLSSGPVVSPFLL